MSDALGGPFTRDELDTSVPFVIDRCLTGPAGLMLLGRAIDDLQATEPTRARQRKAADLERLRTAMSVILANLIAARRNAVSPMAFVAISFDRATYARTDLPLGAVETVRDYLRDQRLVEGQNGFQKPVKFGDGLRSHARRTRLRATQTLMARVVECGIDLAAPAWSPASGLGWRKIDDLVRLGEPEVGAGAEPEDVRNSRKVLLAVNRLNQGVRLDLPDASWSRIRARVHTGSVETVMDRMAAGDTGSVALYRKFKGDWNHGGRLYGGWWQTVPKTERQFLTIDDEPTVELDYSRMHPSLLYAEQGLTLDRDPYLPPGFAGQAVREVGKRIFNRLLNGRPGTLREMAEDKTQLADVVSFPALVAAIQELHRPIADAFGSRAAGHLQRMDSDILVKVLSRTSGAGIAALPIHDSLIVAQKHESLLRAAMVEGYEDITGYPPPPIRRVVTQDVGSEMMESSEGGVIVSRALVHLGTP